MQIFVQSVVMVNGNHFKATPLGNLLKRSITVNPQESDKDSLHVLNGILKDLSLNNRSQNQRCGISYNQVEHNKYLKKSFGILEIKERLLNLCLQYSL